MSSKKSEVIFYAILVSALLIAPAQALMLAQTIQSAQNTAEAHPLRINENISSWNREPSKDDTEQTDVLARQYRNSNGRQLIVVARQASLYNFIHDLYFCMISNEHDVNLLGKKSYIVGNDKLNATLVQSVDGSGSYVSLMWFQNGRITAADRADWRLTLIKNPSILKLPLCRNIRLSMRRTSDAVADEKELVAAAKEIYASPF